MLKLFNDLEPFFMDNYRTINVREYARLKKISPPTASTLLEELHKEGLLIQEKERKYIFYRANRENDQFIDLSRFYWKIRIKATPLFIAWKKIYQNPIIILFGSYSKAEIKSDSDIDLALIGPKPNFIKQETHMFHKNLQVFAYRRKEDIRSPELLNNILNGVVLSGSW